MRACSRCKQSKAIESFYKNSRAKDGLQSWCKVCSKIQEGKRPKRGTSPTQRERRLSKNFKMTLDQYDEMLVEQGGGCAICKSPTPGKRNKNFSVDHDHSCCAGQETCGECIRGLLCYQCNSALAHFGDNLEGVMRVVEYLITTESKSNSLISLSISEIGPIRHEKKHSSAPER